MKKIILIFLLLIASTNITFAKIEECGTKSTGKGFVEVNVLSDVPGLECCKNTGTGSTTYTCKVEKGTKQVIGMLGSIIRYFTFIAGLFGVTFIVYNGILYSMGGAEQSLKDESKKRIIQTLIGLILLLMSGYILQLIAPWVYK